jgi:lambda repressor-like predicted transcriptional regulator
LTEEKLGDISAQIEQSLKKSLKTLSQEDGVSYSSARKAMKLLKPWPYKITVTGLSSP